MRSNCKAAVVSPVLLFMVIATSAIAQQSHTDSFTLETLLARFALVTESEICFTESKTDPLLAFPMESQGRLTYTAPATLIKQVLAPRHETFAIVNDRVTITRHDDNSARTVSLAADPRLGALAASLRGILAGDVKTLSRFYDPALTGTFPEWSLALLPRSTAVQEAVDSITVSGSNAQITRITVVEKSGGITVTDMGQCK
jgi:hypothetical protein